MESKFTFDVLTMLGCEKYEGVQWTQFNPLNLRERDVIRIPNSQYVWEIHIIKEINFAENVLETSGAMSLETRSPLTTVCEKIL